MRESDTTRGQHWVETTVADRRHAAAVAERQGLYRASDEHDACGVALLAHLHGHASHRIVEQALHALTRMAHRGAVGSDPLTGDGAGILCQIPDGYFRRELGAVGLSLPPRGDYAVAVLFLPNDTAASPEHEQRVREVLARSELPVLAWREVPIDLAQCGRDARSGVPRIVQCFVGRGALTAEVFETRLYLARRRIERLGAPNAADGAGIYVCSFSQRTLVYKGLLLPERLSLFYRDLRDPAFTSALAIVHQRFSTNTFPSWERAHPYRYLAHNGEINTIRGNVAWMRAREMLFDAGALGGAVAEALPVLDAAGSDSSMLDNCVDLLLRTGRSLPHALAMVIPEAWHGAVQMDPSLRAFYEYHASLMEPWDGPACIAFSDGLRSGALLDRNGLRPARYVVTRDDLLVLASEAGVMDLPAEMIRESGRLAPGSMIVVAPDAGGLLMNDAIKADLAAQAPYGEWVEESVVRLRDLQPMPRARRPSESVVRELPVLRRLQRAFGYTREDEQMLLQPMAATGKEPVGSMGDDTPLAILSDQPQPLFNYFKQCFAQVTNPPIDPLREALVMSLRLTLGSESDLFQARPGGLRQLEVEAPVLSREDMVRIRDLDHAGLRTVTVDATFSVVGEDPLRSGITELTETAHRAVLEGADLLVLSDRGVSPARAPVPSLLALASVHQRLVQAGVRQRVGLIVESGEVREVMHAALLIGYGAGAVHPYLACEVIEQLAGGPGPATEAGAIANYIDALHHGLLKVLSKMGISTLRSYRGAQLFEAVGLGQALVDEFFPGTPSPLGGIGLAEVTRDSLDRHREAFGEATPEPMTGGLYKWRRDGERHAYAPAPIALLQRAVRSGDFALFERFCELANDDATGAVSLRSLLGFRATEPVPLDEVEPAAEIVKRFRTGAMSFGSLGPEAHECLAIAMNRLGGRSNSGEGGEDPARYAVGPAGDSRRSAIKQIASGRFGVTTQYLVEADELQIKMAQGAKPGEGGQLPGHKVNAQIAQARHATPGIDLISPPPHHDIYSIEDLAELLHDLRCVNPRADLSVKLVSTHGVGTIAAGVAKAGANHILVSGNSGGTGAAPLSSIRHAGLPWELGLAETQQVLMLNGLRGRVRLEVDGQLKTGRDVAIAAMLGADLYGFGTAALIASGCVMMRACHKNTCPVGVATQDPELRKRFSGTPEHVINLMLFIAEDLRRVMARLGVRRVSELVGRSDLLEGLAGDELARLAPRAAALDLGPLVHRPATGDARSGPPLGERRSSLLAPMLDHALLAQIRPGLAARSGGGVVVQASVSNRDRAVGAFLSGELVRDGVALGTDAVRIDLEGTGGQSFGAFLGAGIELRLAGQANDGVGKGLSGGRIVVRPPQAMRFVAGAPVLIGNAALYGATGGQLFVRGGAGERFAVRNSGAVAVVEGVGDHGCEYMTGGMVLILGPIGRNFAAGMTGGETFVLDERRQVSALVNLESVRVRGLDDQDVQRVRGLLKEHLVATGSHVARRLLTARRLGELMLAITPLRTQAKVKRVESGPLLQVVS